MVFLRYLSALILSVCVGVLFAGCGGGGSSSSGGGIGADSAEVTVLLADGPAEEYDHLFITVTEVSLIPEDGGRPFVLFRPRQPIEVDLLDLRDEDLVLSASRRVRPGRYSKIRIGVSSVRPVGGPCEDLVTKLPSGKIDVHPRGGINVSPSSVLFIRLDVDADKSINLHPAGRSGRCIFRPVVFVDIDELEPSRCPRSLEGAIASITPPETDDDDSDDDDSDDDDLGEGEGLDSSGDDDDDSTVGPSSSDDDDDDVWTLRVTLESGRGPIDVLAKEDETRVFDEDGFPIGLGDLVVGDAVRLRGRFDLRGRFRAQMIVIGDVEIVEGTATSTVGEDGSFEFDPDESEESPSAVETIVLSEDSLILATCNRESDLESIREGARVRAVGKISDDGLLLQAVFLLVTPAEIPESLLESITEVEGGLELAGTRDVDGVSTPWTLLAPEGTRFLFGRNLDFPLDLLRDLLECRAVAVRIAVDEDDDTVASEVRIVSERIDGMILEVNEEASTVRLHDGTIISITDDTRLRDLTAAADRRIELGDLDEGTRVRVFGVSGCEEGETDFFAVVLLQLSEPVDPEPRCRQGSFRSYGHGAWGTECNGNNPGCLRDRHFDEVFPDGITLGCEDGYEVHFETSADVAAFLPHGGSPGVLTESAVNPTEVDAGIFAGQLLALTLNVAYDEAIEDFGSSLRALGDLLVIDSVHPCHGLTVSEILEEANRVIGGCGSPMGLSVGEIKDCVSSINENFENGERAGSLLDCEDLDD